MDYFKFFPETSYKFGNESTPDVFRNISIYADVIDQVKDNLTVYENYNILDGERPDNVSQKIYDTPQYYWTFYLLNDNIREKGWPLTQKRLFEFAKEKYPNKILSTTVDISKIFKVGQTITGTSNAATAKVIHRDTDLLQIHLTDISGNITTTQGYQTTNDDGTISSISSSEIRGISDGHDAVHHYEDTAGNVIDLIDPAGTFNEGVTDVQVTNLENLARINNKLKTIRVFKPSAISQVVDGFRKAVKN